MASAIADSGQRWWDATRPPLERATDLLASLSRDQKVAIARGQLDDATNGGRGLQALGLPVQLSSQDGPSGLTLTGTTAFPSNQALAATFDPALARAFGAAVGDELRGKAEHAWLGPAADIARTPLAGRQPENLGEDPYLAGSILAAASSGAQSRHVIATAKHYAGNNQEFERIGFAVGPGLPRTPGIDVHVSTRALAEIYALPFQIAVKQGGALAVMCSYNRVNGLQACEHPGLLGDLKADWNGLVTPDFRFAVRDPIAAANAGVDLPQYDGGRGEFLDDTLAPHNVSDERLDDMVRRTLYAIFASAIFDDPVIGPPAAVVGNDAHRAIAQAIAERGMVLLHNPRAVLPLDGRTRSIAVLGPSGADAMFITGGSAAVADPAGAFVTPLRGITERAGAGVTVTAVQGSAGDVHAATLVPANLMTPSAGTGPGLFGTYYGNGDFAGPSHGTGVDASIVFGGASAPPRPGTGLAPVWSATWTGALTPSESGVHRFSFLAAGILRFYVAGRLVASGYRENTRFIAGPSYPITAAVELAAGVPVDIRIEFSSKAAGTGQIRMAWQPPSESGIPAAVAAARAADVAIVFANNAMGEGMDRGALALPGDQDRLIAAVAAVNPRTIVVLDTGGAVQMPWLDRVAAVVQAWYPGQQFGPAIARLLFGDVNPSGRLPVTFPATEDQGPAPPSQPLRYPGVAGAVDYGEGVFVGYRWYDATGQQPLFAFGHGLSYTTFAYGRLEVTPRTSRTDTPVSVRFTVHNAGARAGAEVAQVYIGLPPSTGAPRKKLAGFARVELQPGQREQVVITLDPRAANHPLSYWDDAASAWQIARGAYEIVVGASSDDIRLRGGFHILAQSAAPDLP